MQLKKYEPMASINKQKPLKRKSGGISYWEAQKCASLKSFIKEEKKEDDEQRTEDQDKDLLQRSNN